MRNGGNEAAPGAVSDAIRRKKQTLMSASNADAIDKVQKNTCILCKATAKKRRLGEPLSDAIRRKKQTLMSALDADAMNNEI
jgi:hypothetical protein